LNGGAQPRDAAKIVSTLHRGAELVVSGAEQDGYISVQGAGGSGWVKTALVTKR
jgi:hypothetical protein